MANEVKWIKIATGVFDDEAFLLIDDMPERDAIELIWFKLLILAGKQNNHGLFLFKDKIAYTDEMLASIFHRPINTVRLAMETFIKLNMVEIIDNVYSIPSWDKYQSLDALEKKKEKDRERQRKHREEQKIALEEKKSCDNRVTSSDSSYSYSLSISNSLSNSIEKDICTVNNNEESYHDSLDDSSSKPKTKKKAKAEEPKKKYGEFGNVLLTETEYIRLGEDYGEEKRDAAIKYLDLYIPDKGYKSKSHNMAMRRWVFNAIEEKEGKVKNGNTTGNTTSYEDECRESERKYENYFAKYNL